MIDIYFAFDDFYARYDKNIICKPNFLAQGRDFIKFGVPTGTGQIGQDVWSVDQKL